MSTQNEKLTRRTLFRRAAAAAVGVVAAPLIPQQAAKPKVLTLKYGKGAIWVRGAKQVSIEGPLVAYGRTRYRYYVIGKLGYA